MSRRLGPSRARVLLQLLLSLGQFPPIQRTIKQLQRSLWLIVRHLMTSLIDTGKREITIFPRLTILNTIDEEGRISRLLELLAVLVLCREGDGLAAEPVADVICVAVDESDTDGAREDVFQVLEEVGPDEVASLLEGKVDFVIGLRVIYVDTQGVHYRVFSEVVCVVAFWGWVVARMADIVGTSAAEDIVGAL